MASLVSYCHLNITWWLQWFPSVIRVSRGGSYGTRAITIPLGGSTGSLVSLEYLLVSTLLT